MGRGTRSGGGGGGSAASDAPTGYAETTGMGTRAAGRPRQTKEAGGVEYMKSRRSVDNQDTLVTVSVAKLDRGWKQDDGYIAKGGDGAISGRREGFRSFLNKGGVPVEAPEVTVSKSGVVTFTNGRHRTSVLRDMGKRKIVIAVPKGQAERIRKQFN